MSSLKGDNILLTGAGSGIGRATAIKLDSLGANLAITDVDLHKSLDTYQLCRRSHHFASDMDVSKADDVDRVVKEVVNEFGQIDHVFNCAGINPTSMPLTECSEEYFDTLMAVNLKGMFNVTKATMPYMRAPGGCYVNVSSISGLHAGNGTAIYCATKFGVIGFSKSMALELGPKGIRVNIVAPGYINTPTNAGVVTGTPEAIRKMETRNSLGRMGTPEDVADVVAFLMSDEARYMNGSVVEVDGMLK